jgi:tetratricopeptide (TPR) repeat protein
MTKLPIEADSFAVQTELENVLTSRCFRPYKALQALLRYLVRQTLADNAANITQYNIAVEGLGKPADFDALTDPLIRMQAGRLRKQLEAYYASEGRFNPLRIILPTGTYQPVFTPHAAITAQLPTASAEPVPQLSQGPGIVCVPRIFVEDEAGAWPFVTRLTSDYVRVLARFNFCQVMFADETPARKTDWPSAAWHKYGADFALFFDLYAEGQGYSLKCSLVHSLSQKIVWTHGFLLGSSYPTPAILTPIFRRIANDTLNYERGIAHDVWARWLLDSGKPIADHHQVMLALRQQQWSLAAPEFRSVLRACEHRLERFPDDVQAMLVYADMYRTEYLLKHNEMRFPITYLVELLSILVHLAPDNAYTHLFVAGFHLLTDNREQCLAALAQAQAINPLDTHLNVTTGLIYIGLGEWQLGGKYIQECIDLSPIYSDWYHIPLCLCHYREGHYAAALQEAKKIRMKSIWGPMLRTALYQRNKQWGKADRELGNLAQDYPNLTQAGRHLALGFTPGTNHLVKQLWQETVPPEAGGDKSETH